MPNFSLDASFGIREHAPSDIYSPEGLGGTEMADNFMDDPRSISEILRSLGYSHRKTAGEMGHMIICDATGEMIGIHHAHTAIEAAQAHSASRKAA
jgi:hypothetical protein